MDLTLMLLDSWLTHRLVTFTKTVLKEWRTGGIAEIEELHKPVEERNVCANAYKLTNSSLSDFQGCKA